MDDAPSLDLNTVDPHAAFTAYLTAHAQGGVPTVLLTRGEALLRRFEHAPPADPLWGRFLIALGHIASELGDDDRASRCFLMALRDGAAHGDHETAVTAGYNQGILQERRQRLSLALAAYRSAAREGLRLGDRSANLLRCVVRALDLAFAERGELDHADSALAKQAWMLWLWSEHHDPARIDHDLRLDLQRQLCALLLPDDPGDLAAAWRAWPPHHITIDDQPIRDHDPATLHSLFTHAARAADRYLGNDAALELPHSDGAGTAQAAEQKSAAQSSAHSDEQPGDAYRQLAQAARHLR